ncbi:hypothetical protein Tco_1403122, partial [Tanacetum coccineum]
MRFTSHNQAMTAAIKECNWMGLGNVRRFAGAGSPTSIYCASGGLRGHSNLKANTGPWYHIMKLKDDLATLEINLSSLFMKKVENGNDTSFWHGKWMGEDPLCVSFPRLCRLESNKCCSVSDRCPIARGCDILPLIIDFGPLGLDNPLGLKFHWVWCRSIRSINEIASDTWKEVAKCWNIPYDSSFDLHDVIDMPGNTLISRKLQVFDLVVQRQLFGHSRKLGQLVFSKK